MKLINFFRRKKVAPARGQLVYAFTHNGVAFYQWPEDISLPYIRMAKIQEYMLQISRAMSHDDANKLLDQADALITAGIQVGKNAVKLARIIYELRERESRLGDISMHYNYLASWYIRQDETPDQWNEQIHREKVELFKQSLKEQNSFFFQLKECVELCKLLNISTNQWSRLENESDIHNQVLKKLLELTSPQQAK